jgi:hypothetical protein
MKLFNFHKVVFSTVLVVLATGAIKTVLSYDEHLTDGSKDTTGSKLNIEQVVPERPVIETTNPVNTLEPITEVEAEQAAPERSVIETTNPVNTLEPITEAEAEQAAPERPVIDVETNVSPRQSIVRNFYTPIGDVYSNKHYSDDTLSVEDKLAKFNLQALSVIPDFDAKNYLIINGCDYKNIVSQSIWDKELRKELLSNIPFEDSECSNINIYYDKLSQ